MHKNENFFGFDFEFNKDNRWESNLVSINRTVRTNCLGQASFAPLKGLSHEIDFKNFDKNLQNLA